MWQYVPHVIIAAIVTLAGYYGGYLPEGANDLIESIPGLAEREVIVQDTASNVTTTDTVSDTATEVDNNTSLADTQQTAIQESTANSLKRVYGQVVEVRDCTSDLDCLEAFPDAGLRIQCNRQSGECYKYIS